MLIKNSFLKLRFRSVNSEIWLEDIHNFSDCILFSPRREIEFFVMLTVVARENMFLEMDFWVHNPEPSFWCFLSYLHWLFTLNIARNYPQECFKHIFWKCTNFENSNLKWTLNVQPTPSIGALGQWNVSTCHDINSTDDCCHSANACSTQVDTFYSAQSCSFSDTLTLGNLSVELCT